MVLEWTEGALKTAGVALTAGNAFLENKCASKLPLSSADASTRPVFTVQDLVAEKEKNPTGDLISDVIQQQVPTAGLKPRVVGGHMVDLWPC